MEIKEVVEKAVEAINQIYGDTISGIMLEEIQLSSANTKWLVTLSFTREKSLKDSPGIVFPSINISNYERVYKQIEIGAKDGKFIGMTIRQV